MSKPVGDGRSSTPLRVTPCSFLRLYPESSSRVTADGVVGLTRAFLAAGVQCVCVSLWPVPAAASKLFTHTFYTALLNGIKASVALTEAMKTLQSSKQFSHPSNWAGKNAPTHFSFNVYLVLILEIMGIQNKHAQNIGKICSTFLIY